MITEIRSSTPAWPWSRRLHLPADWMSHRNAALFALALSCSLALHSFGSPLFLVSIAATCVGLVVTPLSWDRGPVTVALAVILVSTFVSVPGSVLWGEGHWMESAGIALWMLPAAALYLANLTERVFAWLVPTFLIHAVVVIYSGIFEYGRPTGITFNPNLAAGFLVIGIVYLMSTRYRWLALPLFAALVFTESRWAIGVCLVVVLAQLLAERDRRQVLAVIAGLGLAAVLFVTTQTFDRFWNSGNQATIMRQMETRLRSPATPKLTPVGVVATDGLHNVPARIAVESGLVAGVLWVGLGGWALWRGRGKRTWWVLLALLALAMVDYYPWMGHMGGLWWLLIGLLIKNRKATEPPSQTLINQPEELRAWQRLPVANEPSRTPERRGWISAKIPELPAHLIPSRRTIPRRHTAGT